MRHCSDAGAVRRTCERRDAGNGTLLPYHRRRDIRDGSSVMDIGVNAFSGCGAIAEYHIKPTTLPTLANTNAFTSISFDCVLYVLTDSLAAHQAATNWSTYASHMIGE